MIDQFDSAVLLIVTLSFDDSGLTQDALYDNAVSKFSTYLSTCYKSILKMDEGAAGMVRSHARVTGQARCNGLECRDNLECIRPHVKIVWRDRDHRDCRI